MDGAATTYTLDQAAGLAQVLQDGANTYLYGVGRFAQEDALGTQYYYLPDALGSARQMADSRGAVTFSQSFDPFGSPLLRAGAGVTNYGFAGEWADADGLPYLTPQGAPGSATARAYPE